MPKATKTAEELRKELEELQKKIAASEDDNSDDLNDDDDDDNSDDDDDNTDTKNKNQKEGGDDNDDDDDDKDDLKSIKANFKAKMDAMDAKVKKMEKEKAEAEKKARKAEIEAMKEAGKEMEALEAEKSDLQAEIDKFKTENIELRRDGRVDSAISSVEFRNARAKTNARRDIIDLLRQDEDGNWQSKSGDSISETARKYLEDEENNYLLKPKTNTGGNTKQKVTTKVEDSPKSVFDIPQDQMLAKVRKQLHGK